MKTGGLDNAKASVRDAANTDGHVAMNDHERNVVNVRGIGVANTHGLGIAAADALDAMRSHGLGIRGLFRVAIIIVVALASLVLASVSYTNVTSAERARAEASIRSEVNYLCIQLESIGERAGALERIARVSGADRKALESVDPNDYRLLAGAVEDVLSGYTLAETGTVFIIDDGAIVASDDARVPVGSNARNLLGDAVADAIEASADNSEMRSIPFNGVFDQPGGAGAYGDKDDEASLLAGRQGNYTVAVIEPMSMVLRDRGAVMFRESIVGIVILIVVAVIVDRLLSLTVARRIDKTNEALKRITSGELGTRVEVEGTREFKSLASGINITVEALQGYIDEAETRMRSELAAARAIQESVLPRTFPPYPQISKFDVYATMDAAREVGGDFYDFFLVGESGPDSGKLAFLIADVSGKGVPAALFMMEAKAQVRRELLSGAQLSQTIDTVNSELGEGNDSCMFVTMWVGVLDYATGHLEYVNAGHNPPLLRSKGAGWSWLNEKSGLPLGIMPGAAYETFSLDCDSGDELLLYTDGVTEALSDAGELYGEDRLQATLNAASEHRPEALVKTVCQSVASFAEGAEQSDDITILSLEMR